MEPRTQTTTKSQPYHGCAARSPRSLSLLLAAGIATFAIANVARAHEAPAALPEFAPEECIRVIDPSEQSVLEIAYSVAMDDIELTFGDIDVEDARTHQFFAFRGALHPIGFDYELHPFDVASDGTTYPAMLPLWITLADVKRASDAADPTMTAFDSTEVPLGAALSSNADLAGRWLRVTADEERVPITVEQAKNGVRFDLSGVEPGLYSIAGYTFSPPYNAWAARPGVVKVVSASVNLPVAVIAPIHAFAYSHQGRRISACVDVPDGTRMRGSYEIVERPEVGAIEWLAPQAVESGRTEFCFHNPRSELTGSVRLRFELESPDGTVTHVVSPDTMTALQGHGACAESKTVCCDFPGAVTDVPGVAGAGAAGAAGDVAGEGGEVEPMAAPDASATEPPSRGDRGSGCAVASRGGEPGARSLLLPLCVLTLSLLASRHGRRRSAR